VLRFRSRSTAIVTANPGDDDAGVAADDAVLVATARANPQTFTLLYARYLDPVYRYCHVRLGSREAAEDATSEVFLKAFSALGGYRGGVFLAWLYRIAHNVVVDAQRSGKHTVSIEHADVVPDPDDLPEDLAVAAGERETLTNALRALPDDQRAVLELQLAGWSGEQIATALGRSHGAVRMLRLRAVEHLRTILSGMESEGGRHAAR
jgi:RNA polymerase sigma-70 factor (ECF subfamily)